MRKFFLQNESEKVQLQNTGESVIDGVFLYMPDGLGYADDIEYMQSEGFFFPTSSMHRQVDKSGVLVITKSPYETYRNLMNWILTSKSVTIAYQPYGNDWFYQDVHVSEVDKTELKYGGQVLEVPIYFTPLAPFYASTTVNNAISYDLPDYAKKYNYKYPYRYANSAQQGSFTVTCPAQIDCDFRLIMSGALSAPVVTVSVHDTGETIGVIDLTTASSAAGEKIVYDSRAGSAGVVKIAANGTETDLTSSIGLSTNYPTFFKLPPNTEINISITATSVTGFTIEFVGYRYYRTV